jgi:hypothetical protein
MTPKCDRCDRPATYHAAWQTRTMPASGFAYACDEHRFEGMTPLDEPLGPILEHLLPRGTADALDYDVVEMGDVDDEE